MNLLRILLILAILTVTSVATAQQCSNGRCTLPKRVTSAPPKQVPTLAPPKPKSSPYKVEWTVEVPVFATVVPQQCRSYRQCQPNRGWWIFRSRCR